ncbi:Lysophospholipase D gdpd1 [Schistosoma haematobium]|uniref:Lysophospholipase D gdpd1 n=1 Tax=Schistosoma haematobium TaxID=6185 RepID=A0A922LX66_SCHHA|nr:Lysophospholipase D gdpd1 [Schistosoma haematobium]KAH9595237.1 Lysophospholipase D gdpd1 [Schistosoma haematobium]CAH8462649.1 unnamed protein product [Schistosoma haematobium]
MLGFIATVFVAYSSTSYILLRRPIIFLRRKRLPFEASHISHRGGSGEQIENTLEAFSSSLLVGTNMFETDCHITKDNQVVVFHDNTLDRSTGVSGLVKEFSYEDLPRYLRVIEVQFTPGSFCIAESPSSYKIPRLEDLFNKFPNTPINIDIKVNDNLLINEVARLTETYNREHITVWGSMNSKVSKKCELRNKNILTFAPISYVIWIMTCYVVGLLPFIPIKYDCFEIPLVSVIRSNEFARRRHWDRFLPHTVLLLSDL